MRALVPVRTNSHARSGVKSTFRLSLTAIPEPGYPTSALSRNMYEAVVVFTFILMLSRTRKLTSVSRLGLLKVGPRQRHQKKRPTSSPRVLRCNFLDPSPNDRPGIAQW
jgi:hypothetical protein